MELIHSILKRLHMETRPGRRKYRDADEKTFMTYRPARSLAGSRSGRIRHSGMGSLVQPSTAPRADRIYSPSAEGGTLLQPTARTGHLGLIQANHPPGFPGRFNVRNIAPESCGELATRRPGPGGCAPRRQGAERCAMRGARASVIGFGAEIHDAATAGLSSRSTR